MSNPNAQGDFSNLAAGRSLAYWFGGTIPPAPPATYYIGLSSIPSHHISGHVNEITGGGYYRVAISNEALSWTAAGPRVRTNANVISFDKPSGDWTEAVSWFLVDAPAGGNVICSGNLPTKAKIFAGGIAPRFEPGALTFRM